ncbi:helix-turn-helix transcriptional regulator [Empedobacter stercoris]|uniref:helix-turn-helix transcriptional regulator n=1 Tax=Empedobacter stercoris TaxID=1628248 RepID=UPI0039EB2CD4
MRKTAPTLRILRLIQFIKEQNSKGVKPNKKQIIDYMSIIYPDDNYNNQLFDRDKKKIRKELQIDLKTTEKVNYFIDSSEQENLIETSLDYYEMFSILTQANALPAMFLVSERKPLGLNQISSVVSHIKEKNVIQFNYSKYDTNEKDVRKIEPLAIKESRERWYIIGNDFPYDKGLRAFGFDRISDITLEGNKFEPKYTIVDIKAKYEPLFAMFDTEDKEEEIILEFDSRDGSYIKSFPIHHSQKAEEIENGVRIYLKLKTTPDFIMEIMSRAWSLKVVQPVSLCQKITEILKDAISRNQ